MLPLMAMITQVLKVAESAALSEGQWKDWDLLPIPDPEGTLEASLSPLEQASLAALQRERQALRGRITGAGLG